MSFNQFAKYGRNSALNILFDLKMLIDSQTGLFMISQYVGFEFVRTQQNLCVLLIKRLAYICLLMAAGVKWRCSNLQIKMYENISDSPISGLLWQWSKSNERKFGRRSNPQRNNHNLFFCLPASERWLNKYDISKRESEREGKTHFFLQYMHGTFQWKMKIAIFSMLTQTLSRYYAGIVLYRSLHSIAHPPPVCENRANTTKSVNTEIRFLVNVCVSVCERGLADDLHECCSPLESLSSQWPQHAVS